MFNTFYLFSTTTLITCIASFLVGFFVIYKNNHSKQNFLWGLVSLSSAIWSLGLYEIINSSTESQAIFWNKILYLGAIFIPIFYYHFTVTSLGIERKKKINLIVYYIISFIFLFFNFTSKDFIAGAPPVAGFKFWLSVGYLYYFYFSFFVYLVISSFFHLARGIKVLSGNKRSQMNLIFLTGLVGFGGGVTNFFPQIFGIYPLGNYFVFFYVLIVSYAITVHKLMDIKLILRASIVYALSLLTVAFGFYILQKGLGQTILSFKNGILFVGIIVLIMCFDKIKDYYFHVANKYFFSSLYDINDVMIDINDILKTTFEVEDIYKKINDVIEGALHCEGIAILIYEKRRETYGVEYNNGFAIKKKVHFGGNKYIHDAFTAQGKIIAVSEIKEKIEFDKIRKTQVFKNLIKYGVELLVPLNTKEGNLGFLAIGGKMSNEDYNKDDYKLLEVASVDIAIALEKSLLYEKTQRFNIVLKNKVNQATAKLKFQNEELKTLDKMKSEFISVASHQLRTPLTANKWALEFLTENEKNKMTRSQRESLDEINQSNERLIKLVNELLNISRIDDGRLKVDPVPVDVAKLIKEQMKEFMPIARHKELKVIEKYEKLPLVKLDKDIITKAISNFLSNAIKYNRDGKRLWVSVKKYNRKELIIKIQDEGIGIPESEQKNLFQKFYRASNAATSNTEGTGLGLYIAKKAIEQSGGTLWFESKENIGTTFYITIPFKGSRRVKGEKGLV